VPMSGDAKMLIEGTATSWSRSAFRRRVFASDAIWLTLFLLPSILLLGFAQFYPLLSSLWVSFFDWSLGRSPTIGPFVGFNNYARAFGDPQVIESVRFTVLLTVASTTLQMVLGVAIAVLLIGEDRTLRLSRALIMLPMVIAPIAVGTMWRMILAARNGPLNRALDAVGISGPNWLGDPFWATVSIIVIDAWQWTPFVVIIVTAALASLPTDILKAASVDGAGRWGTFRHIILPMIMPVLVLVAMFRAIDALMTLDIIFTTTAGGPGFATHTVSFWIYQQGLRYFNISYAAACSWLLLVGCIIVGAGFLLWRHWLMRWQREPLA
jgi:multiple sugar transport system permease protein